MKIFDLFSESLTKKKPFVVYKKPNKSFLNGVFLNNEDVIFTNNFTEKGFVFAPFNQIEKSIVFNFKDAIILKERIQTENFILSKKTDNQLIENKNQHIQLVEKTVETIQNSKIQKIVISRKEEQNLSNFDILTFYKKLISTYPNAFVYCWFHPKVGLWLGASPETLLKKVDDKLTSVSLAGTQKINDNKPISWKEKEIDEQKIVTNFIQQELQTVAKHIKINETKTEFAGSIAHLKTILKAQLRPEIFLQKCIEILHPTPAVCGFPKKEAKQFILDNEEYHREFYTGFLGEINLENEKKKNKSHLFVNLRCMQVIENKAFIYVGGGITKSSIAEIEWEETIAKSQTLKSLF